MEVKGSGIADRLLGGGSPDMDEFLFFGLVNTRIIQNFVKNANKARVHGIDDSASWEGFMREEVVRETSFDLADVVLGKNGLDAGTITQRKRAFIDQLIEEHKDKTFDEILYLL